MKDSKRVINLYYPWWEKTPNLAKRLELEAEAKEPAIGVTIDDSEFNVLHEILPNSVKLDFKVHEQIFTLTDLKDLTLTVAGLEYHHTVIMPKSNVTLASQLVYDKDTNCCRIRLVDMDTEKVLLDVDSKLALHLVFSNQCSTNTLYEFIELHQYAYNSFKQPQKQGDLADLYQLCLNLLKKVKAISRLDTEVFDQATRLKVKILDIHKTDFIFNRNLSDTEIKEFDELLTEVLELASTAFESYYSNPTYNSIYIDKSQHLVP